VTPEPIIEPPLDAHQTLKPDEPGWTVQGGDPLGGPLLRIWAVFARLQAGMITPGAVDGCFAEIRKAANNHLPENEREAKGLLIRATATEEVSWDMDAYRKGNHHVVEEQPAADATPLELERIDLHDLRVRVAQRLSGFRSETHELREALAERGYDDDLILGLMDAIMHSLKFAYDAIEPRRMMK
jgi:hypothetical protein